MYPIGNTMKKYMELKAKLSLFGIEIDQGIGSVSLKTGMVKIPASPSPSAPIG